MKTIAILALCMTTPIVAYAQEDSTQASSQKTKIIGGLSDGKPSPPAPPKVLPLYQVNSSIMHQKKDHRVVINKVKPPAATVYQPLPPLNLEEATRQSAELEKRLDGIRESGGFFTVSATIYDYKTTHVRWWYEGKMYSVFSNVDWNHLGGFHEFEGRGKRFNMILFSGNISTDQIKKEILRGFRTSLPDIPKLPLLTEHGAAYMVIQGDEKNDAAMEFIEAIHDLYDEHRDALVKASLEREKNRLLYRKKQEQLKLNPPQKPDVIINYWKTKTPITGKGNK